MYDVSIAMMEYRHSTTPRRHCWECPLIKKQRQQLQGKWSEQAKRIMSADATSLHMCVCV